MNETIVRTDQTPDRMMSGCCHSPKSCKDATLDAESPPACIELGQWLQFDSRLRAKDESEAAEETPWRKRIGGAVGIYAYVASPL